MISFRLPRTCILAVIGGLALTIAGCTSQTATAPSSATPPPPVASLPPAFPPNALVGRWGFAAYHRESDRARIQVAAKAACNQPNPYDITPGPTGGVMMRLADQPELVELRTKGGPGGKTYVGPDGPPGDPKDREVVSFDGKVLILHWVNPEINGRYGTEVYVRCGARA
jgi:hypothetical protein